MMEKGMLNLYVIIMAYLMAPSPYEVLEEHPE